MFARMLKESRRTAAVRDLGVLDASADPLFARLVANAAAALDAPMAALSFVENRKLRWRAVHGLHAPPTERHLSICTHVVERDDVLETCAPELDERFRRLSAVEGDPRIRYYLGAPVRLMSGLSIGAICVADSRTRQPASADQRAYLSALARQAALALELQADLAEVDDG